MRACCRVQWPPGMNLAGNRVEMVDVYKDLSPVIKQIRLDRLEEVEPEPESDGSKAFGPRSDFGCNLTAAQNVRGYAMPVYERSGFFNSTNTRKGFHMCSTSGQYGVGTFRELEWLYDKNEAESWLFAWWNW